MMIYTIIGEKNLVTNEVNNILSNYNMENIVFYDLDEVSINKVLEDINTVSLFGEKVVVVNNLDKLNNFDNLEKYINNPSLNILILTSYKLFTKNKIIELLKSKTKYKELFKYDYIKYVKDNLEDFEMKAMDINLLISYCNNDINRINNELEKLKLYKLEDKKITSDDIKLIVKKGYDSTIFDLIDSINLNDKDKIYSIYKELIKEGETDERIMFTIANHYRLLFNISRKLEYMKDEDIIKEYKMHPYRLTKLKEQINMISNSKILNILKSISDIDIEVKKGNKNINTELILFFQNL